MANIIDENRLADLAITEPKKISGFIENQFPALYRENGRELIDLVKSYYEFLEETDNQSIYNIRRIYEYRNIDTTLEKMLIFFKEKFLNGLFFESDIRFVVKNILDLYRRKGTDDGIRLFFKLFFDNEVELFFPSQNIFKPSSSVWKSGTFIQLYSTNDISIFSNIINKRIFGDKTNAAAFVDNIYLVNVNGSYVPIIFISSVKGEFSRFDTIYSNEPELVFYGRVYGSLRSVSNFSASGSALNEVGDIVDILSNTGNGAKGRVSRVSQNLSGEVNFQIKDGNYGYTTSNTDIIVSNQNAFFNDNEGFDFIINEQVKQVNSLNIEVFGIVVGNKSDSIGVFIENQDPDHIMEQNIPIDTVSRDQNISRIPLFITDKNDTPSAEIGTIRNTETITIITDLISDYLDVSLNSSNYSLVPPASLEMSGTRVNGIIPSLNTPLNQAFVPETFEVGEIESLKNVNPGIDVFSDVFVLARENILSRFRLTNQVLNLSIPAGVRLFIGDVLLQTKQVQTFEGNLVTKTARGVIVDSIGNDKIVKQLTFESFELNQPVFKEGVPNFPIVVNSRGRDITSLPLGLNADITGNIETVIGRILEVDVIDSGIGYEHNSNVDIRNTSKQKFLIATPDNLISVNDPVSQTLSRIDENDNEINVRILGRVIEVAGNIITIKRTTDQRFVVDQPVFIGIGQNRQAVTLLSEDLERIDTNGTASVTRQGITEGRWIEFSSNIREEKVLQDSFFFQDFSYEITTDIEPSVYEDIYKDVMHTSGLKLFTRFGKNDSIDIDINIPRERITFYEDINESNEIISILDLNERFVTLESNNFLYLNKGITVDSNEITVDLDVITIDLNFGLFL
jgi:hypothetical protein